MNPLWPSLGIALFGVGAAAAATACSFSDGAEKAGEVATERYTVIYRFAPASPAVAEAFKLVGRVCPADGTEFAGKLSANADMPQHGHGMNYQPRVSLMDEGEFVAEGFVLHMPGHWRFSFKLADGDHRETLSFEHHAK